MRTVLLALMLLAGCGQRTGSAEPASEAAKVAPLAEAAPASAAPPPAAAAADAIGTPRIAYSYSLAFELPTSRLDAVLRTHRAACETLGPARCQLLAASRTGGDGDAAEASLDLRLVPGAVRAFEARLTATASDAGGTVLTDDVAGEDITRQLIDADAALKAKRTLRDRLQALLETRQGRLADLLEVEKALSATQQELDTATAELAELRQRIDFSKVTVSYRSTRALGSTARPLAEAVAGAGATLSASLALLLTAAVAVLPWLVPAGLVGWMAARWRARRRGQRRPPPA